MKFKNIFSLAVTTAIFLLSPAFNGCTPDSTDAVTETEKIPVRVAETEATRMDDKMSFTGTVEPYEEAHVGSGGAMRIEKIFVDVDDYVRKGQLLAQMDKTQLFQAQVRVNTLEDDLKRLDTLRKVGAVTQQNYEQLKAELDIAKSTLENLTENTQIHSPLTGIVTGRYYSDGEIFMMSPGPSGKPAIVSILQIQPVKIIVNVSERFFPDIKKGMRANVVADMYPGKVFKGHVYKVHPVIDRTTGTFKVEINIPNERKVLRPGMYVRVTLNLGEKETFIVPSLAVLRQAGTNERYVFVEEDGVAIRKTVRLGQRLDDMLEITEGLKPGENLVISGQHNLLHKQKVRIVE